MLECVEKNKSKQHVRGCERGCATDGRGEGGGLKSHVIRGVMNLSEQIVVGTREYFFFFFFKKVCLCDVRDAAFKNQRVYLISADNECKVASFVAGGAG